MCWDDVVDLGSRVGMGSDLDGFRFSKGVLDDWGLGILNKQMGRQDGVTCEDIM